MVFETGLKEKSKGSGRDEAQRYARDVKAKVVVQDETKEWVPATLVEW